MPVSKLRQIGAALIARGASEKLVRRIVSDKRLPNHEKIFLLSDIYAKLCTEPHK